MKSSLLPVQDSQPFGNLILASWAFIHPRMAADLNHWLIERGHTSLGEGAVLLKSQDEQEQMRHDLDPNHMGLVVILMQLAGDRIEVW